MRLLALSLETKPDDVSVFRLQRNYCSDWIVFSFVMIKFAILLLHLRILVLLRAKHDHRFKGIPVLQNSLKGKLSKAWRLEVMVWHIRI